MRKWVIVLAVMTVSLTIRSKNANAQSELTIQSGGGPALTFTALGNAPITELGVGVNGWTINVVTGETFSPGLTPDGIDITSLTVSCGSISCYNTPLLVSFSGTNFTQPVAAGGFVTHLSTLVMTGLAPSVSQTASNGTNAFFGAGPTIGTVGPLTTSFTSGSAVGGGPAGPSPYSLSIVDTFKAGGSSASMSAFGSIAQTPEPSSILLFGTGLLGLGGILRRRMLA